MMIGIIRRASIAVASLGLLLGSTATSASALVAPVSAGPPKPIHVAHLDLNGFFPSVTQIHVGDSVRWTVNGFHTISFLAKGQAPPPLIIPASGSPISGKLDAGGASFWFNGKPNQVINAVVAAPSGGSTYDGKSFLNSGLPEPPPSAPKPFVVKFLKTGTFTFHCLVHPGMQGVVKVLPKGKSVPRPLQDRLAGNAEEALAVRQARVLQKVKQHGATVLAGNDGSGPVAWLRFFPENLKIKAGTTVNFKIASKREIHTITIGPESYTAEIEKTFTTPLANPMGPPTLLVNPLAAYPSDPGPLPPYTGANHGNGFESAGVLAAGGPLPSHASITFTKPGVYHFECVIHPNMDAKITVTG
jgi:plastocyanin